MEIHEPLAEVLGVPPIIVQLALALTGLITFTFALILCAVCSGPKRPSLRRRPQQPGAARPAGRDHVD